MINGKRLKEKRIELGLSQEELGDLIGVGKASICCYENETRNPSIESLVELVTIFGVTADYIIGTDVKVKTFVDKRPVYRTLTKEEILFIDELRKDKVLYEILFYDPRRGSELIRKKLG